ncbi:MAG: hypothetical protein GXP34_14755 [Actinobacteria bacterium]|nr:hypothetical protein [Actinomycetota bacterium]
MRRAAVLVGAMILAACTGRAATTTTTATVPATTSASQPTTTVPTTTTSGPSTTTTTTMAPPAEHRIQARVVDGKGEFYDTATGERFVPRGMNYNRFLTARDGSTVDLLLSTNAYDPATVDEDLAAMRSMGFNVVRVMLETCGVHINGCITGADGRLNPAYMDNVVDFLRRVKAHDMFVMVSSNTLPDDGYWINATARLANETFASANNEFLNPKAVPIYVDYWRSVVQALVDRAAPLDVIWGYELRQEHYFHLDYAPLSLDEGLITTANGETYDMASRDDKNRMVDEGLTYWADLIRTAIREIDPTALVTVGFFTPNAPNPVRGPGATRFVRTAYFLRNSTMDFFDLHHYPGNGVDDADVWENFGIASVDEKPIVLGELGAYYSWFSDAAGAAAAIMRMQVESCEVGFQGWLVWSWRGDNFTDIWWASDGDAEIARVVSPAERPDPCAYRTFDFIRWNVALDATATASSAYPSTPAGYVNDGTPAHWNATGRAPQWVELALAQPTDIETIRLVVAQDPPGASVHELWIRRSGGNLERVHVFDGTTAEGDILTYEPPEPLTAVELVRVVTKRLAGGLAPAWHEIELLTRSNPD